MKQYLIFNTDGTIKELATSKLEFIKTDYNLDYQVNISYKKNNFIIIYNNNSEFENISKIPFFYSKVHGDIIMFKVDDFDNFKIKSLTEKSYIKLIEDNKEYIDYSSDDFNPDTCDGKNTC